jgi:branched-chain amino acid transport system ATP-binding protein
VPEGRQVFPLLSAAENLAVGAFARGDSAEIAKDLAQVYALFPRLQERQSQTAGMLSGGEQQMLAIGRALMARPTLLMLDEPSLGLSPRLSGELFAALAQIARDVSILMVEQNARRALGMANRAYLLALGRIVGEGEAKVLARDSAVARSYLGL